MSLGALIVFLSLASQDLEGEGAQFAKQGHVQSGTDRHWAERVA